MTLMCRCCALASPRCQHRASCYLIKMRNRIVALSPRVCIPGPQGSGALQRWESVFASLSGITGASAWGSSCQQLPGRLRAAGVGCPGLALLCTPTPSLGQALVRCWADLSFALLGSFLGVLLNPAPGLLASGATWGPWTQGHRYASLFLKCMFVFP